ncbi:hypothetical protein V7x_00770 [Crateriforma conspicua]|uniref:Cyclic GMP-AMP synthase n=1 Tax=Crateriforma conspicua TaxID=2527996 RepID=A0A5C6FTM2_9PLAN|nr:nucleotidyltransferase [Crateriforma conspicua]TWU64533.1 hypothetical protein V7x_00770 [Crateriforma conspicua]
MTFQINREKLLAELVDALDIPQSHYEQAKQRAESLEEWLLRPNSLVRRFNPDVYPQGSFRYGTVIRPIHSNGYYDLDLVVTMDLSKSDVTQEDVKRLLGAEIKAYAEAKNFNDDPEEKPRCWRLNYADDVSFHMDILPSIPADEAQLQERFQLSISSDLARHEIAITDTRHAFYRHISPDWYSSNPRGFAKWFEANAKKYAVDRIHRLVANRVYASVDEIPPYEWKTLLQRVIQIIKRHRDVYFLEDATFAPISMILTTLATKAYGGEPSIESALRTVVDRMPAFIQDQAPRVANPVNPKEDFADKWRDEPRYELNFREWHAQLRADVYQLCSGANVHRIEASVKSGFDVRINLNSFASALRSPTVTSSPAPLIIPEGPKPWGQ